MDAAEKLANLKARSTATYDAWQEALAECREARKADPTLDANGRGANGERTPIFDRVVGTAKANLAAQADLRAALAGRFKVTIPADTVECARCGGYGGHHTWPGFTCYGCEGRGWTAQ